MDEHWTNIAKAIDNITAMNTQMREVYGDLTTVAVDVDRQDLLLVENLSPVGLNQKHSHSRKNSKPQFNSDSELCLGTATSSNLILISNKNDYGS
jgi:hypothetical protein